MPAIRKSIRGKNEVAMVRTLRHRTILPHELTKRISAATGASVVTTIACMQALSTCFLTELNSKGGIHVPGIGYFQKRTFPAKPGRMQIVAGLWKACKPKPIQVQVEFTAIGEVESALALSFLLAGPQAVEEGVPAAAGAADAAEPDAAEHADESSSSCCMGADSDPDQPPAAEQEEDPSAAAAVLANEEELEMFRLEVDNVRNNDRD